MTSPEQPVPAPLVMKQANGRIRIYVPLDSISMDKEDYIDWLIEQLRWVVIHDAKGTPRGQD